MRRIVDAHHHLWDLSVCHYPWLMAKGVKRFFGDPTPIQKDYLVADLREDACDYDLCGSVHVQVGTASGDELRETEWLQATAECEGLPSAIVAFCDLAREDAAAELQAQRTFSRLRGIRQIVGRSAEEDAATGSGALLDDPTWRANLGLLRDMGLSFDLQLVPGQMRRAADVLAAVPGLAVALCHCGSPWDQSAAGLRDWQRGLESLAALPDVYCKLSGFGMFDHGWSVASIRPLVESCIAIFGAERCMFGSNFPVDKLHASYADVWGAYEAIAVGYSSEDEAWLFGDTARAFYRI